MGIVRTDEYRKMEMEEFRRMLLSCAGVTKVKGIEGFGGRRAAAGVQTHDTQDQKVVCVTSGVSFLGIAIVNQLLLRGYSVRIILDNQEDIEKLREMEMSGEMRGANSSNNNNIVEVVIGKLDDGESLLAAFDGCCAVFHTAAFIDPGGLSGYSKSMAEIEVRATETVTEACAMTPSVRNCVLTSSLLACLWRDNSPDDVFPVIDHNCWSDESLCVDKKLWYALGKLKAEKAAWRIAEERGLKLATLCPGLITGSEFFQRNPTSTIAYLKGVQEMYAKGLLATVDVKKLAEAHVSVFEAMKKNTAFGRYICFEQVVENEDEVRTLEHETGLQINLIFGSTSGNSPPHFELSKLKLDRLMSRTRCNSYG